MAHSSTRDLDRYDVLKRAIADVGLVRRGSLVRRLMSCGKPGCCCQATPPKLHGPYYQWTRKVRGKTVTVRLTPQEAELFREWSANTRQLDKLLAQMQAVSLRVTERLLRKIRRP